MTSNTLNARANKGSKFWVQTIINSSMRVDLESQIGLGPITWLSPLRGETYKEYKLNEESMLQRLNLSKADFNFWPQNQPQWDAIGVAEDGTIILVEAKAHIEELRSSLGAKSNESLQRITTAMKEVFEIMNHLGNGQFDSWIKKYYQLGNRLTYIEKLNEMPHQKAKLVLLNIVDDPTYESTSKEAWQQHTKAVFKEIIGTEEVPENVIVVNFQV